MFHLTEMRPFAPSVWHIGDVIRKLRERRDWTIKDLAKAAKIRAATIGAWEDGSVEPNPKTLRKVAHALDVKVSFILSQVPVPPTADDPRVSPHDDHERAVLTKLRALSLRQRTSLMHIIHGIEPEPEGTTQSGEWDGTHDAREEPTTPRRAER